MLWGLADGYTLILLLFECFRVDFSKVFDLRSFDDHRGIDFRVEINFIHANSLEVLTRLSLHLNGCKLMSWVVFAVAVRFMRIVRRLLVSAVLLVRVVSSVVLLV
jgi:hypothetical protein